MNEILSLEGLEILDSRGNPTLQATVRLAGGHVGRYAALAPAELPLKDTVERLRPHWQQIIAPAVAAGERVIVAAHGNSLRALVKHLDGIGDADIVGLDIPTGTPLVCELSDELKPIRSYYL